MENPIEDALTAEAEATAVAEKAVYETRQAEAFICRWHERIESGRKHDKEFRDRWAADRRLASGVTDWAVDANQVQSIMEVMMSFLYAKNPDISATPSDSVNRARIQDYREVAKTLQVMTSRVLSDAGLKRRAKKWLRGSMTVGIGWIKAIMQTHTERQPQIESRINDLTDQLGRIEALRVKHKGGKESGEDYDSDMESINQNIATLNEQLELQVVDGLVLDIYAPEDVIVAPECGDIENYRDSPWIAFDTYKTEDEVLAITGWQTEEEKECLTQGKKYAQRPRKGSDSDGEGKPSGASIWSAIEDEAEHKDGFLRITEIWCKQDGRVYTIIDGIQKKWAVQPFTPITGLRWYPCFDLPWFVIDGERYPQSLPHQLRKLADEYASTMSNRNTHRRRSIPAILFNKQEIEAADAEKLAEAAIQEYLGLNVTSTDADMRKLFFSKPYAPIDPALYDTTDIILQMEKLSGVQDALQSGIQVEKTATEAKIQQAGFSARSDARRDTLEDALTELSQYVAQLILLTMDQSHAVNYAGREAMWIDMSPEEALRMFNITIKAGSTGKPQALSDRESWPTLMPLIQGMIDKIGQARLMGAEWAAKPWIALLDETLKRLDDSADVEMFLPVPPATGQPQEGPSEEEKANIELTKAKTEGERADTIATMAQLVEIPPEMGMMYLFGGSKPNGAGQPQQGQPTGAAPAPSPIDQQ